MASWGLGALLGVGEVVAVKMAEVGEGVGPA